MVLGRISGIGRGEGVSIKIIKRTGGTFFRRAGRG